MDNLYLEDKKDNLTESKEKHQPLITFAKLNKFFLIPFICPIFCMLASYFMGRIIITNVIKKVEFICTIYYELAYVAAGLFHFVSYFNSIEKQEKKEEQKEEAGSEENSQKGIYYIYNRITKKNFQVKISYFILLGLLVGMMRYISFSNMGKNIFEFRIYFLIFIPLFSKLLLNENIHRHHYVSIIIAIGGVVFLLVPVGLVVQKEDIIPNILFFFLAVGYSFYIVLIKYIIQKYFISPLKLSLIFGIFSIFLTCLGFIIYSLIKYHDLSYFKDCLDFSEVDNKLIISIYFIATFLVETTHQLLILLAIFYFSPTLIIVTDIISPMLLWIVVTIEYGYSMPDVILNPIGYVIVIFSSLIYNELIIFNFCGLSKNTKKFVENRESEETIQINYSLEVEENMHNSDDQFSGSD